MICKSNAHKPGTIVQTDVSLDKHLQRNVSVIINTAFINADVKWQNVLKVSVV